MFLHIFSILIKSYLPGKVAKQAIIPKIPIDIPQRLSATMLAKTVGSALRITLF